MLILSVQWEEDEWSCSPAEGGLNTEKGRWLGYPTPRPKGDEEVTNVI